jgi:hypothetical protein
MLPIGDFIKMAKSSLFLFKSIALRFIKSSNWRVFWFTRKDLIFKVDAVKLENFLLFEVKK